MSYTIRDVDSALMDRVKARNITVPIEGMDVRVRVYVGSPDELIAQKRLPFIGIESGWMIRTPIDWQSDVNSEIEVNGNSVDVYTYKNIDIFYTYKVGFYVAYQPHCSQLEVEFIKLFTNMFSVNVIDSIGVNYIIPFIADTGMINMDENTSAFKKPQAIAETNLEGDLRIYRRDKLVTAQLLINESSVESKIRPFNGLRYDVSMTVAAATVAATVAMPTINFVEE